MVNTAHASMTGSELHEPKGADTANAGEVYIADGAGSGSWGSVGTSSFTGAIADFMLPIAPSGWLELDGSDISIVTYSALYTASTIQQTGTRTNASPIITGLSSTTHMRVGYYAFGTGIAAGTTILSIDSSSQITLSGNASSSGSSTVVISPWYLDTGTIRLPNATTSGRYRRSRTSSTAVGQLQSDQNKTHTHTYSSTSGTESAFHTHAVGSVVTGTTNSGGGQLHNHALNTQAIQQGGGAGITVYAPSGGSGSQNTGTENQDLSHTHLFTGSFSTTSQTEGATHTHAIAGTTASGSADGSEVRPVSIVVITCVKT